MTDIQPLKPTDEEIETVVQTCRERGLRELDVFRAVLAKWSTPTPVGAQQADLPPLPTPDLRDVGTTPKDIQEFLRGYATEYARVALAVAAKRGSQPEARKDDEQMMLEACETISNEGLQAGLAIRAALASHGQAPTTQPAPQADSVTAPAGGADWQDISTAPKDGTRFVAVGQNYGLDSEAQHTCIAQWFRGCWMEVSDWNEASELKYLTHWMPLPPLPCHLQIG